MTQVASQLYSYLVCRAEEEARFQEMSPVIVMEVMHTFHFSVLSLQKILNIKNPSHVWYTKFKEEILDFHPYFERISGTS